MSRGALDARRRLVEARDDERRRLQRDLHDGAQQSIIVARIKVGLARSLATAEPHELRELLDEIESDLGAALESIAAIVRGVAPQLLEAGGLRMALAVQVGQAPIPIELRCPPQRFTRDVERALYYSCLEAIQNLSKHAHARHAVVSVWSTPSEVRFEVRDDGRGFDLVGSRPGRGLLHMRERLQALAGDLVVASTPGAGTRVTGWLPLAPTGRLCWAC